MEGSERGFRSSVGLLQSVVCSLESHEFGMLRPTVLGELFRFRGQLIRGTFSIVLRELKLLLKGLEFELHRSRCVGQLLVAQYTRGANLG